MCGCKLKYWALNCALQHHKRGKQADKQQKCPFCCLSETACTVHFKVINSTKKFSMVDAKKVRHTHFASCDFVSLEKSIELFWINYRHCLLPSSLFFATNSLYLVEILHCVLSHEIATAMATTTITSMAMYNTYKHAHNTTHETVSFLVQQQQQSANLPLFLHFTINLPRSSIIDFDEPHPVERRRAFHTGVHVCLPACLSDCLAEMYGRPPVDREKEHWDGGIRRQKQWKDCHWLNEQSSG